MKKVTLDFTDPINVEKIEEKEPVDVSAEEVIEESENESSDKENGGEETPVEEEQVETEEIAPNPEDTMKNPEPRFNPDDFIIKTIAPFSMSTMRNPADENSLIATLFYIVQTKSDIIFTLYTSYLLEEVEEAERVSRIPFHVDQNFSSFRLSTDMVLNNYDVFTTDFDFTYRGADYPSDYKFTINAIRHDRGGLRETVQFEMTSDVFMSLKYIDNYPFDHVDNKYELSTASITARINEEATKVVIVDKIDRIVAMAGVKESTTCAIEYIVHTEDDEKYTMMSTFNTGKKFNKKKFKGMTIERLQENYPLEADQYFQMFSIFCHFHNIDKEYLIMKAKNKDNKNIAFLLDTTVRTELESMIGEY